MAHWEDRQASGELNAEQELFFAPEHAETKMQEWGRQVFGQRLMDMDMKFKNSTESWLKINRVTSRHSWELLYKHSLEGGFNPETGYVVKAIGS